MFGAQFYDSTLSAFSLVSLSLDAWEYTLEPFIRSGLF